jgi:hypothetical protein
VIDATGRCDPSGIRLKNGRRNGKVNKSSNIVYYDSPYQYMEHRNVKLQDKVVRAWENKVQSISEKDDVSQEKTI